MSYNIDKSKLALRQAIIMVYSNEMQKVCKFSNPIENDWIDL